MKVEINIDPERIDYDAINKTIEKKLESISNEELLVEILKASRIANSYADDLDTDVTRALSKYVIGRIIGSFKESYCDEYGSLTNKGKEEIKKDISDEIKTKVNNITSELFDRPEFKNIITDFVKENSGTIIYSVLTSRYNDITSQINAQEMVALSNLDAKMREVCTRLNIWY